MSLNALIIDTLRPLGVPVAFQAYSGKATTYITFFEFNQNGKLYADDQEIRASHSVQVNIWSKGDYTELATQVKEKLIEVGFTRTFETELYEDDTKTYHKVFRFNFVK